jgi:hypothetical protein
MTFPPIQKARAPGARHTNKSNICSLYYIHILSEYAFVFNGNFLIGCYSGGGKNGILELRCTYMEKKLIIKMIKNCFKQYYSEVDSLPMTSGDLEELADRIIQMKADQPTVDLYEAVNDTVYEFLTG